ncbi:hypothetical protein K466DRAFT_496699 [Polyporus arcularius HHB13444]|uniref:DUF1770-domain-containing protein n=1 Tax=Polyporus arcularius HHB13444 TaxID=1314778 RepID=A0A5C3P5V0_9APHY|nr:hypothetical protein K466DRAFT_496699 [Polyporus arcularius HHB13444]
MIRASEESEDKLRRISERRRIPPVPDLRFEYSYTRSISPYVHVERVPAPPSGKGKEKAVDGEEEQDPLAAAVSSGEVIRVDWGQVIWITTKDQIISPLVQGALWGVASHFLRPLGALLGAHVRGWWAKGSRKSGDVPEGNGAHWLRNWIGSILTPAPATGAFHR